MNVAPHADAQRTLATPTARAPSGLDRFAVTTRTVDRTAPQYSLRLAQDDAEIAAVQRLRHRVFAEELGASLPGHDGLDADEFDVCCDHIVVRDDRTGEAVGTYRMLPPERAAAAGRWYADAEFDLAAITPLRDSLVEVGRSCVHPDHRNGAVIGLMWAGISRYMLLTGHRWLAGCASIPLGDGGGAAASVWDRVRASHLSPEKYRVTPRDRWDDTGIERPARLLMPPLLRGYLRLGAWICGEPAHDRAWGVADLFVLLAMDRVNQRYLRHFLGNDWSSLTGDWPNGDRPRPQG